MALEIQGEVTPRIIVNAMEARFPQLRGTVLDSGSGERRPFLRFFAAGQDLSLLSPDVQVPPEVSSGGEPFLIVGSVAGG